MDKSATPPVDRALADLAARQHGRVALRQLEQLTQHELERRFLELCDAAGNQGRTYRPA